MTSTAGTVSSTMRWKTSRSASSAARSPLPAAPSWYEATITSAEPSFSICVATALTASTMSMTRLPSRPAPVVVAYSSFGEAPITATRTPLTSRITWEVRTGSLEVGSTKLAESTGKSARSATRPWRSSRPLSNSWLPAARASRPRAFMMSIVGLSCCTLETEAEPPIRSPAEVSSTESAPCSASNAVR